MLIIHGESASVTTGMWNGERVWIAGKSVSFDVIQTYMNSCIMVADTVDELWLDMGGIYVINQGGTDVAEEAVLRGAYCLNCSMAEGLWRLKDVV